MMHSLKTLLITMACIAISASASAQLKVVATLSTFGELVEHIGGEHVDLHVIVPPKFNPHFIEPRSSDLLKVKQADIFVCSGVDLEAWKTPLLNAAGNPNLVPSQPNYIALSEGVNLLHVPTANQTRADGDIHLYGNPHYWLDPHNALIMGQTIAQHLSTVDPDHQDFYTARADQFRQDLETQIKQWKQEPFIQQGAQLMAYHDQWPYLLNFCNLSVEKFVEPKPGIVPGPRYLKMLERYIKEHQIKGIIWSSVYPSKSVKVLAKRSDASVIQLAQGVGEVSQASNYVALIQYNIDQLRAVLEDETQ